MSAPEHPAAAAAAAWHLAGSLVSLKAAVDAHWPGRDKRSDGGIGDARHQAEAEASDHNPWLNNTVRAYDFTATQPAAGIAGVDADWLAEQLRVVGSHGDPRLTGGGYVIWNRHITAPDFSRWLPYTGSDPHTTHVHVSVSRTPSGYESPLPWDVLALAPLHPPAPEPADLPTVAPVPPTPDWQAVPVVGPHQGNTAAQAPAPVADEDGPEPGHDYPPPGSDAIGSGLSFRAQYGNTGPRIADLQGELNRDLAAYAQLDVDGVYGANTAAVLQDFARRVASDPHCPAEHHAALAGAHGDNVGPHLAAVFPLYGVNV